MDASTSSRAPAEQTWPECRNTAVSALSTAASRSVSAKTMFGFLPPSSNATRLMVSAPAFMMARPVATPPVKDTRSTRGSLVSSGPTSAPAPVTRLATPAGSPASVSVSISKIAVDGVSSAGLSTKLFPASRAGATFQATWSRG